MAACKSVQCGMMDRRMAGCVGIKLQLSAYSLQCCQSSKVLKPEIWYAKIVAMAVGRGRLFSRVLGDGARPAFEGDDCFPCWELMGEKGARSG